MPWVRSIAIVVSLCMLFLRSAMAKSTHDLPIDGKGGYLWNNNITFPVYPSHAHPNGGLVNTTWAKLNSVFEENEQINATAGVCFGLCILAFLNMLALTPKAKRNLPLYKFTLIALTILAVRYLTLIILYTVLEVGSAYYNIAADYSDGETAKSIVGIIFVIWLPPFALLSIVICFYVQGRSVLVLIAMKHRLVYKSIMAYLVILSICTIGFRIVYAAFVTVNQFSTTFSLPDWMNTVALATYTAVILSWSLVFSWQVGACIFNRYKMGGPMEKSEGMAILFMTGIESMLVPMIFTILRLCSISWFNAEYLIMPSVAIIIPFGSIWAGAANQHAALQRAMKTNASAGPMMCNRCSEMISNATTAPTRTNNRSGDTTAINSTRSQSRIHMNVFPKPPEANNSGLSGATDLNSNLNPSPNMLANMPITTSILGTREAEAYTTDVNGGCPIVSTTLTSRSGNLGLKEALHDDQAAGEVNGEFLTSRKYGVKEV